MPDWIMQLGGYLFAGGMAWGAIRADLKTMHENIKGVNVSAMNAHRRIDDHINYHIEAKK